MPGSTDAAMERGSTRAPRLPKSSYRPPMRLSAQAATSIKLGGTNGYAGVELKGKGSAKPDEG